jgi:hypothetical protein
LEGAHAFAACLRCHNDRGPVTSFSSRGCGGCHPDPHKSTMGFDCARCHEQNSWRPTGTFSNHAQTRFPLTGLHATVECEKCHTRARAGDFKGAPTDCYSCHSAEFQRAPQHITMNFSHDCQSCHTTATWASARFDHSKLGPNPDCYSCHANDFPRGPNHVSGNFSHSCANCHNTTSWASAGFNHSSLGPNPDCYSCHANDFTGAQNHVARNYPHTCANCHNTATWSGATFSHSALGANPVCYSCHSSDYQQGPNHASMSYPTTCQDCHNTTSWTGAVLNHQFPIRGHHNVDCTLCHQGGNTTSFTCLSCHEHRQSSMDSKHNGVSGYHYESLACYQCHPHG